MTFEIGHKSYSQINRYEQCPKSYELHYIQHLPALDSEPATVGRVLHATCEKTVREALTGTAPALLSEDAALHHFRTSWAASGLTGVGTFQEGVQMVKDFVRDQGVLDPRSVLAVERQFRFAVGRFELMGFIDRVDRIDDETIEIIDYKTNRQLFTRDELDTHLQLAIYQAAAQRLWPWAKKVRLSFWMLRHGVRVYTTRTAEQIAATLAYVETTAEQIATATSFPARLNAGCAYCDHRHQCGTYEAALCGTRTFVCKDTGDLEAVAKEREEVSALAKILEQRKRDLEKVLKTHLQDKADLTLNGIRYAMQTTSRPAYPLGRTAAMLAGATDLSRDELLEEIAVVDNAALEAVLAKAAEKLPRPKLNMLKAELAAVASRDYTSRFSAKAVRQ